MAVKVFCNQCQKFIKDAGLNDIKNLTGEETCTTCQEYNKFAFTEIQKLKSATIDRVKTTCSKIEIDLDNAIRRVLRGEEE